MQHWYARDKADEQAGNYKQHRIGYFDFVGQHDNQYNGYNQAEVKWKIVQHLFRGLIMI